MEIGHIVRIFRGRERDVSAGGSVVPTENLHFKAVVFFVMKSEPT